MKQEWVHEWDSNSYQTNHFLIYLPLFISMHCPFLPLTSIHEFFYFYFLVTLANTHTHLKESLPAWSKHCHVHEWVWYNQISWWQCSHPIQILGETWGDSILSRKSRLISRNVRIGLSSHFISGQPNIPYMRASLDMLGEVGFAHMAYSGGPDLSKVSGPNQAQ